MKTTDTKNKKYLTIGSIAYGGDGVGRLDSGKVCFVPGVLPGERVGVRITQDKKYFSRGEAEDIAVPSPERIVPPCSVAGCPGCAYLHATYEAELRFKEEQLADFLVRSGITESSALEKIFPSPERFASRNKIKLNCRNGKAGYIADDNVTLLPVERCLLAADGINEKMSALPEQRDGSVTFRITERDGVVAFSDSENISGHDWLTEHLPGAGKFKVPVDGFFQTNIPVAAELVRRVVEMIAASGRKRLIELYCGVGVFSIAAAEKIPELQCTGIELNKQAIRAAKFNASSHGVAKRCRFFAGDAGKLFAGLPEKEKALLLLDPPRGGLSGSTLRAVEASGMAEIIYISCAPDTLRRDLTALKNAGWRVVRAGALDMFPCTAHFETVVLLEFAGRSER